MFYVSMTSLGKIIFALSLSALSLHEICEKKVVLIKYFDETCMEIKTVNFNVLGGYECSILDLIQNYFRI